MPHPYSWIASALCPQRQGEAINHNSNPKHDTKFWAIFSCALWYVEDCYPHIPLAIALVTKILLSALWWTIKTPQAHCFRAGIEPKYPYHASASNCCDSVIWPWDRERLPPICRTARPIGGTEVMQRPWAGLQDKGTSPPVWDGVEEPSGRRVVERWPVCLLHLLHPPAQQLALVLWIPSSHDQEFPGPMSSEP